LCVLRCLELCGPRDEVEDVPDLRRFAEAVVQLASNEQLLRRVVDAVDCGDSANYRAALDELKLGHFCRLICHWVCLIRYRRICEIICRPEPIFVPDPVSDLRAAAEFLATALKNERAFADIAHAAEFLDCERARTAINEAGLIRGCEYI